MAEGLQKREYSNFRGLIGPQISSVLPFGNAFTADHCELRNSVLEAALGDTSFVAETDLSNAVESKVYLYVPYTSSKFLVLTQDVNGFIIPKEISSAGAITEFTYTTGTATTDASPDYIVDGTTTVWSANTNVFDGSIFKINSHADTEYKAIGSSSDLLLSIANGGYTGGAASGAAYTIKHNMKYNNCTIAHSTDDRASVSNGSPTVTKVAGSDFTSIAKLRVGDKISFKSTQYTISAIAATTITLSANYTETTDTDTRYSLYPQDTRPEQYAGITFNGFTLLTNSNRSVLVYNGSALLYNSTIPTVRCFAAFKARVFGGGTIGDPDALFWCPVNDPNGTWNANAFERIASKDESGGIQYLLAYGNSLLVFKRFNKIYRVYGDFVSTTGSPDYYEEVKSLPDMGEIVTQPVVFQGIVYFVTTKGLYAFNGDAVKVVTRALEQFIKDSVAPNTGFSSHEYFMGTFDNKLIINLKTRIFVIDQSNNVTEWQNRRYHGGFINFTQNIYSSPTDGTNHGGIFQLESGYSFRKDGVSGASAVDLTYVSHNDFLDEPDLKKHLYDVYVIYEQTGGSNSLLFDYKVDQESSFTGSTTITTNGTSGAIAFERIRIGKIGRSFQWRLRGNGTSLNNRVIAVILTYKNLEYV